MGTFDSLPPAVSVVVCTYDRADLMAGALRSLCEQSLNKAEYEVIVVDNNSRDNTQAVVEEFWQRYSNVRYYREPQQGLSHARNRGWQEARGEYVAYIDDDCKVPEQWLAVAKDIIERIAPAAFGGPTRSWYNTLKPHWYSNSGHQPFMEARFLKNEYECTRIFGCNAVFRRNLLQELGGFDSSLGMSGKKIFFGEETALLMLINAHRPEEAVYYDPRLYLYHLVRPEQMKWTYLIRASFAAGRSFYRLKKHNLVPADGRKELLKRCLRTLSDITADMARSILTRDRQRYPLVQNYLHKHTLQYVQNLGNLYERYQDISRNDRLKT